MRLFDTLSVVSVVVPGKGIRTLKERTFVGICEELQLRLQGAADDTGPKLYLYDKTEKKWIRLISDEYLQAALGRNQHIIVQVASTTPKTTPKRTPPGSNRQSFDPADALQLQKDIEGV